MRVLLIDVNCKYSSTGKIVYDLYNRLNQCGHLAAICYGRGREIEEPNIYKFSSNIEVYCHALLTRLTGLTGCYSPLATLSLLKFIESFQPDVVHIHELHAYFVNYGPVIEYLKKRRIKVIWTFHSEFMYTGRCGYAYDCEKWKTECGNCPQIKEYPSSWFFDFTRKMHRDKKALFKDFNNLIIVTPSQWLAGKVRQSFFGEKDIRVINNGVNHEIFKPRAYDHLKKHHEIGNEKIVLAVAPGLMDERKGGRKVLELAERFRGEQVKFILIGVDNPPEEVGENVIALGRTTNQEELAEYYSMADIFVICSKMENFPTTCIEALSCGTPVVGFDAGGTKETAPEGFGIFVPYGDMNKLEKAVRDFLDNPPKREDITTFACEKHNKNTMMMEYLSLYKEVISEKTPRR